MTHTKPLTYERAASMIEQLRGLTVLGPWVRRNACEYLRHIDHGYMSTLPFVRYEEDIREWTAHVDGKLDGERALWRERFTTAESAMAAVDAILSARKEILAAGITPTTGA